MIGALNYINGLFLGKEELVRQQTFINNNLISLIQTTGLKGLYSLKERYEVDITDNILSFVGPKGILGINNTQQVIYYNKEKSISLVDYIGNSVYLSLTANNSNNEEGTVSLSSTGVLTGVGTRFLDTLRASYTKKGTRVYFPGADVSYLVESITSNTVAKLIGPITEELTNVEWAVMGTFSPFSTIEIESNFPYRYYSYELNISTDLPDELSNFVIGKVTWDGGTPSFVFVQNRTSTLGMGANGIAFDYVVDSDESLRLLRGNSQATNVLIKRGTYTYNSPDGRGLVLHPNTKLVWAEGGSLIKVLSTPPVTSGSFAFGYTNLQPNDVQIFNVSIENGSFAAGFKNVNNIINGRVRYTGAAASYGFESCSRLLNCFASSVNAVGAGYFTCNYLSTCYVEGFTTGYSTCRSVSRCHAECSSGYSVSYASRKAESTNVCADTANGGFNSALGDIPAPGITNYNRIYFQVVEGSSQEAVVRVTAEYNVASNINFETLIVNGLGKEEVVNISLSIGEKTKDKSAAGLTDPTQTYSILSVTSSVASDATYTYEINF